MAIKKRTMTIYYTGIGAGRRQFFNEKSFKQMLIKSRDLQSIIRKFGKVSSYTELSIKEICDIIGASIM